MPATSVSFRRGVRRRNRQGRLYAISQYSVAELQAMLANHQKWQHDFENCAGCRKLQEQIEGQRTG